MTYIKIFDHRYINSRAVEQIFIIKEDTIGDEDGVVWNVEFELLARHERIWVGQFESLEDAQKAVEKMFNKLNICEFVPDLN
jgi:hypothetical protein